MGLLFEVTNIFLNVHRYTVILGMDGSRIQIINGALLVITFFSIRIIYGLYSTSWLLWDIYSAVTIREQTIHSERKKLSQLEFSPRLPVWIIIMHIAAQVTLHSLNFVWFTKIVQLFLRRVKRLKRNVFNTSIISNTFSKN